MGCIPADTRATLTESIDADRLVIVAGAGLSMAKPSLLPSAQRVAQLCYDTYDALVPHAMSASLRDDLNGIAEHFMARGNLHAYFLPRIVPWDVFVRPSNAGHVAIADMVLCKAIAAAITTNYDWLVERVAHDKGVAMETALDGDAALTTRKNSPFLKIHGCSIKAPYETVWAPSQLTKDPVTVQRIAKSKVWLNAHLREKDYVFVGFWSDWDYLNGVIEAALTDVSPASIILVNLEKEADLVTKANALWNVLHKENVTFKYVQCSGADFLDELRVIYSTAYMRKAMEMGKPTYEQIATVSRSIPITESNDSEALYAARCDAEGVPRSSAATKKWPQLTEMFGVAHYLLNENGAIAQGADYQIAGQTVRIVNGAGREIGMLKSEFAKAPAALEAPKVVICAAAHDFAVPPNIVREGRPGNIVRPAAAGLWLTLEKAREHLRI